MSWLTALINVLVAMLKGLYSEISRDKANKHAGALEAENNGLKAQVERGQDAKKTAENIARLDDDALDELMRNNRDERNR